MQFPGLREVWQRQGMWCDVYVYVAVCCNRYTVGIYKYKSAPIHLLRFQFRLYPGFSLHPCGRGLWQTPPHAHGRHVRIGDHAALG